MDSCDSIPEAFQYSLPQKIPKSHSESKSLLHSESWWTGKKPLLCKGMKGDGKMSSLAQPNLENCTNQVKTFCIIVIHFLHLNVLLLDLCTIIRVYVIISTTPGH